MKENLLKNSFSFSVRLLELNKYLKDEGKDFPLSERLLACGSGICVNLRMADIRGENGVTDAYIVNALKNQNSNEGCEVRCQPVKQLSCVTLFKLFYYNALSDAVESGHLLKLMAKTGYLTEQQSIPLRNECDRLIELIENNNSN